MILVGATTKDDKVEALVRKTDMENQPEYLSATMSLVYKDKNNKVLDVRKLKYWRSWKNFDSEALLMKFMSPENVKNTTFLSVTEEKKNRQMIYLPGLGRIRTIKKTSQTGSFMNSDFNYNDLRSWKLSKNENRLVGESDTHFFLETRFKNIFFNQRLVLKINKESYFIEEVKYFKKGGVFPYRKMIALKIRQEGGIYFSSHFKMITYKEGSQQRRSSTEIILEDWDVTTEIDNTVYTEDFMSNELF